MQQLRNIIKKKPRTLSISRGCKGCRDQKVTHTSREPAVKPKPPAQPKAPLKAEASVEVAVESVEEPKAPPEKAPANPKIPPVKKAITATTKNTKRKKPEPLATKTSKVPEQDGTERT